MTAFEAFKAYANVSAVVVTRGDVDLAPVLASLPFEDVVVWDNSRRVNFSVAGRYMGCRLAANRIVYVQDDDCIVDGIDDIVAAYKPGHVTCNMPQEFRAVYPDSALVGFGAVFDRRLPWLAFERFAAHEQLPRSESNFYGDADWLLREADAVFTCLTPRVLVDVPYRNLDYASAPNRLWKQPGHVATRNRVLSLVKGCRDG